jgi:hypothetical protein
VTTLSRFAGWAFVIVAALTPALAAARATSDDEEAAASSSLEFNEKDGTLNIE